MPRLDEALVVLFHRQIVLVGQVQGGVKAKIEPTPGLEEGTTSYQPPSSRSFPSRSCYIALLVKNGLLFGFVILLRCYRSRGFDYFLKEIPHRHESC